MYVPIHVCVWFLCVHVCPGWWHATWLATAGCVTVSPGLWTCCTHPKVKIGTGTVHHIMIILLMYFPGRQPTALAPRAWLPGSVRGSPELWAVHLYLRGVVRPHACSCCGSWLTSHEISHWYGSALIIIIIIIEGSALDVNNKVSRHVWIVVIIRISLMMVIHLSLILIPIWLPVIIINIPQLPVYHKFFYKQSTKPKL